MSTNHPIHQILSEATAVRLYNSVRRIDEPSIGIFFARQNSIESIRSSIDFNNSCRICRWNRSDMELRKCPCLCKGTVGFIHMPCLKKWIMHRRNNHCEICSVSFDIPDEKFSIWRMIKSFGRYCAGPISKHLLFSISLIPLTYIILQQVVIRMENMNISPNEDLSVQHVALAASALMTSSALFFQFFEFISTRLFLIQNILRHWWLFGNCSDFALVETESEILDLFI